MARQVLAARRGLRWQCLQWLFWQVGGLGPMAGQAHHFRVYADVKDDYAIERYERECQKLYAVLEGQLQAKSFLAVPYSYCRYCRVALGIPSCAPWY